MAGPTLVPHAPPGRRSRKARAYAAEIRRLQAEGYTLDEIRRALADAGIEVSKSTVQREAARKPAPLMAAASRATGCSSEALTETDAPVEPPTAARHQNGRDVAAAFVSQRNTNPLFRKGPQ